MTTPLGMFTVTSIGGACLFLMLVRRPMRDDDSPQSLVLAPAVAGARASARVPTPSPAAPDAAAAAGPGSTVVPTRARAFDHSAAQGVERFKIAYRRVRLSSAPDDLRSTELGRLDRGDEVELVDSFEGYLQVRTPTGVTGWIHRNTTVGGAGGAGPTA